MNNAGRRAPPNPLRRTHDGRLVPSASVNAGTNVGIRVGSSLRKDRKMARSIETSLDFGSFHWA